MIPYRPEIGNFISRPWACVKGVKTPRDGNTYHKVKNIYRKTHLLQDGTNCAQAGGRSIIQSEAVHSHARSNTNGREVDVQINHAGAAPRRRSRNSLGQRLIKEFVKYKWVYVLMIPVLAYYICFKYLPMSKMVIAFQDFNIFKGIEGSKWVGLDNFVKFFQLKDCWRIIRNTLLLNLWSILFAFPAPIIFALMLNEVRYERAKRLMQTVSYMPHFISMVVVCGLIRNFCSSDGVINTIITLFNPSWSSPNLLDRSEMYRTIHILSGIWQNMGWDSIIYLATLSGIDPQLYEAAYIDGASRMKRIIHVTLPGLTPIIIVKLIMRLGNIFDVAREKILLLYNPLTYETADTISTYMYRYGLLESNYSMGAAVGVFNSIISITILVLVNTFFRRFTEESLW